MTTTETRTATHIAFAAFNFVNRNDSHTITGRISINEDELGNVTITAGDHCITINDEWDEENDAPAGHTFSTWFRDSPADNDFPHHVDTDGSDHNDGLEEFLIDWIREHATA